MRVRFRIAGVLLHAAILAQLCGLAAGESFGEEPTTLPDAPAKKYSLRYKFTPGETIRTKVLHQVLLSTTIAGSTQDAETISGSVKVWRILDAEEPGQFRFEHSVESVDMRQKVSGRQEIVYNSQKDKTPPPGYETVAKSVGVPLTELTIDACGKTIKRTESRGGASGSQAGQMVMLLPEEPVAVGDSWNSPLEVPIKIDSEVKLIKTRQHYTLEKVANGVATIAVSTQVLTPVNSPKIQAQIIQRLTKGTIRFDIDAGRVLSQKLELDERVLGFNGADSSLHYLGRFTEEYLPPETAAVRANLKR